MVSQLRAVVTSVGHENNKAVPEAGSYLRLIDFCVSLNSRLESNEEEEIPIARCVNAQAVPGFGVRLT